MGEYILYLLMSTVCYCALVDFGTGCSVVESNIYGKRFFSGVYDSLVQCYHW